MNAHLWLGKVPLRERVPRAWGSYGLALIYVPVCAVDQSGYAMLMGPTLLLTLAVAVAFLVALLQVVLRWKRSRFMSLLPPFLLLLALPLGAVLGADLLRARFYLNRTEYESVAKQVVAGTYPGKLLPEHKHLGAWVAPAKVGGKIEGACFLTVTHGFAGHGGFCYAADHSKLREVIAADHTWRLSSTLTDQWAVVQD